ncbi:MAG: SAF domain-containing protein [Intrasporangium sp.]|uniref:SAF domain-containing protein n=1 Tax=Intrasporangium sp. TaxID=1925024 RepID=UPI002648A7DC|nr:SAF domain-containing protein [Intrasporangium sp.]MDN5797261.1 SAF domain-containing protein [Intrasporangium sp.]
MTTTAAGPETAGRSGPQARGRTAPGVGERVEAVEPAPRLRRRPMLVAASVAAVCLGALLGVWTWTSISDARSVIAARNTITRGQVITAQDLMIVQVGVDPGLRPVPGRDLAALVGQRAAMDMSAGSLITAQDVAPGVLPPAGKSVVGVALPASLMPGEPLRAGDRVRVVSTPGPDGEVAAGRQVQIGASVVGLYPGAEQGKTVVAVLVEQEKAGELAARAATGRVAMVLDPRER